MRSRAVVTGLALFIASCGGATEEGVDATTSSPPATVGEETTTTTLSTQQTATTTEAVTTTSESSTDSTTTTVTTTTVAPGPGALALTRVVFEPSSYIVVTNVGGRPVELGEHWICVRPSYQQLPAMTVGPGDSIAIGLDDVAPPDLVGFAGVIELGPVVGTPSADDGEMGLYTAADFGSPSAIADYVEWGSSGHGRSEVAVEAGIWSEGAFIDIPPEAISISSSGTVGANEGDWFVDMGG